MRCSLREGGFGLTAVSSVCLSAFYCSAAMSAALSLRWICKRKSLVTVTVTVTVTGGWLY